MTRDEQITAIAEAFSEVMRQWLSPAEFAEMKRRNECDPAYAGKCCASHDFCDANMAMDAAMQDVLGDAYRIEDETLHPIWNEAWSLARKLYLGTQ
jgi:hypothetical protein